MESYYDEPYIFSCDEIRTKINALLRSGEVKVTHFQKELDINSISYGRFIKLKGAWNGIDNQTFDAAHRFFRKREEKGIKIAQPKTASANELRQFDTTGVVLDGESNQDVAVYDDCNEVRRKINAHLKEPGVTQAGFCREIAKFFMDDDKKIQSKQLSDFLKKKGESAGAESCVYYGAYVFFEKLRIKKGTKKGKKRMQSEARYPGGRPLEDHSRRMEWVILPVKGGRRGFR